MKITTQYIQCVIQITVIVAEIPTQKVGAVRYPLFLRMLMLKRASVAASCLCSACRGGRGLDSAGITECV